MPHQDDIRKLLAHVAARSGGVDQLATKLGISHRLLNYYLTGRVLTPDSLVLRVVDLLLEQLPPLPIDAQGTTHSQQETPDDPPGTA